jgi:hypothetical protein
MISRRDICFDSNGFFFFRQNTTAGNPNNFVDLVTINNNGDMTVRGTLHARDIYFGSGTPAGPMDIDETGALAGSRLQFGLLGQPGFAHHMISRRDICFDSANGFFFFRQNTTAGDPNNFVNQVTISGNGDMTVRGTLNATAKNFSISHPLDPDRLRLSHGSIEGPEYAVFYRGQAELEDGVATITLPTYFEALTRKQGRTVQLTPLAEDDGPISALAASRVRDGAFTVRALDDSNPSQEFYWEVKAVRSDVESLAVEVQRSDSDEITEGLIEPARSRLKG